MPSSGWDEYLDALSSYLEGVRAAVSGGRLMAVAGPPNRPSTEAPDDCLKRVQALRAEIDQAIEVTTRRRDEVVDRLRAIHVRNRPVAAKRPPLVSIEL